MHTEITTAFNDADFAQAVEEAASAEHGIHPTAEHLLAKAVAELLARVKTLETELAALKNDIGVNANKVDAQLLEHSEKIDELDTHVTALEGEE